LFSYPYVVDQSLKPTKNYKLDFLKKNLLL